MIFMTKNVFFVIFICLIITLVGCTGVFDSRLEPENQSSTPQALDKANNETENKVQKKQINAKVYFVKATETSFKLESETVTAEEGITPEYLMGELLKGPKSDDLESVIPDGTKVLWVDVKNNIAYLNLSKEIKQGNYGSEAEMMAINSIVYTLTELNKVNGVQILIEGKKDETLWGHADISEPIMN